jgi:hypothetical protein
MVTKSASIGSLYRLSVALAAPLNAFNDVQPRRRTVMTCKDAEKILDLSPAYIGLGISRDLRHAPRDARRGVAARDPAMRPASVITCDWWRNTRVVSADNLVRLHS